MVAQVQEFFHSENRRLTGTCGVFCIWKLSRDKGGQAAKPTEHRIPIQLPLWGEPTPHASLLHRGGRGNVAVCHALPDWQQEFFTAGQFVAFSPFLAGEKDAYISQNTFSSRVRRVDQVQQIRSLWVDLDCYRMAISPQEALEQSRERADEGLIPWPSAAVWSGRGLYVQWLLRPAPRAALPRWAAVQQYLTATLADLGADPAAIDAARVLRLAGTVNSKTGATVGLVEFRLPAEKQAIRYELADLARQYLPEEWHTSARVPDAQRPTVATTQGQPQRKTTRRPIRLHTIYSLYMARLEDLNTLGSLRGWDLMGHREQFVFLWRYWTCCILFDPAEALRQALDVNRQFRDPLPDREVERATRSAERAWQAWAQWREHPEARRSRAEFNGYNYTNRTLIGMLEITPEEQRRLRTIIGTEEKKARHRKAEAARKRQAGEVTMDRAQYLETHSVSRDKPWEDLGISRRAWYYRRAKGQV